MKILFLSHKFYPDLGGIEVNSEVLASEFLKHGAEVKLATWTKESGDKKFKFDILRNPDRQELWKVHRWADVIYENNPSMKLSWPNLFMNKPRVVAIRTWVSRMDGRISLVDRLKINWIRQATRVIAVSDAIRKETCESSTVIGNPYRNELFKNTNQNREKDFIFLGRLVSDKGADMAIDLIGELKQKLGKEFSLTIVGDGDERLNLQNHAKALNLDVQFTGILRGAELTNELNRHKYLLAPSRWREPFGNIALEGMACGLIPIVSDGGGLVDAVGAAGVVFSRNDQNDFFDKTKELVSDETLQKKLQNAASMHLKNHLPEEVGRRYFKEIQLAFQSSS